jgi:hypothetical protein
MRDSLHRCRTAGGGVLERNFPRTGNGPKLVSSRSVPDVGPVRLNSMVTLRVRWQQWCQTVVRTSGGKSWKPRFSGRAA